MNFRPKALKKFLTPTERIGSIRSTADDTSLSHPTDQHPRNIELTDSKSAALRLTAFPLTLCHVKQGRSRHTCNSQQSSFPP